MSKVGPCAGGCWFCGHDDGDMFFTWEWDAYFHEKCLIETLKQDPFHPEAEIINREFDYKFISEAKIEKEQKNVREQVAIDIFQILALAGLPLCEYEEVLAKCLKDCINAT